MAYGKDDLVRIYQARLDTLGVTVGQNTAWAMFKEAMNSIVDCCLSDKDDYSLVLSGIGRYEIFKAAPRMSKVGVVDYVPKLRYRPSSKITEFLEESLGQKPDPVKKAEALKALYSDGFRINLPGLPQSRNFDGLVDIKEPLKIPVLKKEVGIKPVIAEKNALSIPVKTVEEKEKEKPPSILDFDDDF